MSNVHSATEIYDLNSPVVFTGFDLERAGPPEDNEEAERLGREWAGTRETSSTILNGAVSTSRRATLPLTPRPESLFGRRHGRRTDLASDGARSVSVNGAGSFSSRSWRMTPAASVSNGSKLRSQLRTARG